MTIYQDRNDCILLVENRIIIAETLQQTVIQLAHEGHQGIVGTKQLLHEKVWFVNIDRRLKHFVSDVSRTKHLFLEDIASH